MKKLSRRELFRGAGATAVGGAALAVGLKPTKAAPTAIPTITIPAGSRVTDLSSNVFCPAEANPEILRLWSKQVMEEVRKATLIPDLSESHRP